MAQRFIKKPLVVEAVQFLDEDSVEAIAIWQAGNNSVQIARNPETGEATGIYVNAPNGTAVAARGDWIVEGHEGDVYVVQQGRFDDLFTADLD